jgi:hypothetical protein
MQGETASFVLESGWGCGLLTLDSIFCQIARVLPGFPLEQYAGGRVGSRNTEVERRISPLPVGRIDLRPFASGNIVLVLL